MIGLLTQKHLARALALLLVAGGSAMVYLDPDTPTEEDASASSLAIDAPVQEAQTSRVVYGTNFTYECPEPAASLRVSDAPWYVGSPVHFDLTPAPCLEKWSMEFGDGSPIEWPEENRASHAFERRGSYTVYASAYFPNGAYVVLWATIFVNAYPAPDPVPAPERSGRAYHEEPLYAAKNLTHHWYLDNGLDWYNRPYSQLSYFAWVQGFENATYGYGAGGVTLHVLSLLDGHALTHYTPHAYATIMKLDDNPSNQVPPCRNGYTAHMPSYAVTDLPLPSGWGFRSQAMGCGHDAFVPGKTQATFCIEWDGELLPANTPYLDGYIYDACDVQRTFTA